MAGVHSMTIDHVGYAVKQIKKSIEFLQAIGFVFEEPVDDTDRNIKVCFGRKGAYCIELVSPLDGSSPSPVDTYLKKIGCTPYHFCYRSDNMDEDIEHLKGLGYKLIHKPKIATAFSVPGREKRVAFLWSRPTGLIEIVDARAIN